MTLVELILVLKEGQFAEALFADDQWFIIKSYGHIRYCMSDGTDPKDPVSLTPSNLRAIYTIMGETRRNNK